MKTNQKNLRRFTTIALILLSIGASYQSSMAQLGKLKGLKNKVEQKVKDKTGGGGASNQDPETDKQGQNKQTTFSLDEDDLRNDEAYMKLLGEKSNLVASITSDLDNPWSNYFRIDETYAAVQKLDYPNTRKTLEEKGRPKDEVGKYTEGEQYDEIAAFPESMQKIWEEALHKRILELFDKAYADKKHSVKLALEELQEAIKLNEMMTMPLPEHQEAQGQLKELKDAYSAIGGVQVKEKYASEFNKANKGKILFSASNIQVGQENTAQFIEEVRVAENSNYQMIAYSDKVIKNAAFMMPDDYRPAAIGFVFKTSTSQKEFALSGNYLDKKLLENSYLITSFVPNLQADAQSYVEIKMAEFLAELAPRTHQISITMLAGMQNLYDDWEISIANDTRVEIAQGKVNVNMSGVDTEALKKWVQDQKANYEDKLARERKLPDLFSKPDKLYQDAALSPARIQALIQSSHADWTVKCVKVLAADRQYAVTKNALDVPTARTAWGTIGVVYQKGEWCYYSDNVVIVSDYKGGGTYGPWRLLGVYDQAKIACQNVNCR